MGRNAGKERCILVVGAVVVGDPVVEGCDWHVRRSLINFAVFSGP